ncbi:MAG: hypothetical protein ACREV5_04485 [Steroidobacter sp.]
MTGEKQQASKPDASASRTPVGERMQTQRERLFKAMAIIDCCRYGSDSMIGDDDDARPDIVTAPGAAYDLIIDVAEALEALTKR